MRGTAVLYRAARRCRICNIPGRHAIVCMKPPGDGERRNVSRGTGMDLQVLHEFAVLAERLNYTQAARELNVAPSTLSRHVSALEAELGVRLFARGGRTSLTYAGHVLLEEAGAFFTAEERVARRLDEAKRAIQGKVRLEDYAFSRSIKNFMITAAKRYRAIYRGVTFEFVPLGSGSSVEGLLADGDMDVGVLVHTGPETPEFTEGKRRVIPLWHERGRMGVYTRTDQLRPEDLVDGEVAIDVLRRLPVVLPLSPEYANFRADITALCARHGFEVALKLVEMGSLEDLAMIDMAGCAQIVLDTDLLDPANPFMLDPDCSFHLIHEPCWAVPYLLLPPREGDPVVDSFADFLRELAEERAAGFGRGA